MCLKGAREVQEKILDKVKNDKLQVFVVWLPVLRADTRSSMAAAMKNISDKRVKHYWDGNKKLGYRFGKVVELPERQGKRLTLAWDVYFAFGADKKWDDDPPKPSDWMHQLGQGDRRLDADKLRKSVEKLIKAIK